MFYRVAIFLILLFVCSFSSTNFIFANEPNHIAQFRKKYNLSICAVFKNEAKYLKEWIEYHRLFGVDHFYLYNVGSRDDFYAVLKPYIIEDTVTLINWPEAISDQDHANSDKWALSTQLPAYENAVNFLARNETKWLAIINIDQFLVCPSGKISTLLKEYDNYPGITLAEDFFDASIQDSSLKRTLVIQSLTRTGIPNQDVNKSVKLMIFKPDLCAGFFWPPYQCRFRTAKSDVAVDRQKLRINHYMYRTEHSFIGKRKYDSDAALSEKEISILLDKGYVIEDQDRVIYQYVPELLKRVGQRVEWNW